MTYEYWVIRYVPDPVRGERVNVGVIAGSGREWAVRRVSSLRRASRLGGSATASDRFLNAVQHSIEAELEGLAVSFIEEPSERMTRGLIEDWRVRMTNLVQISEPRPVMAGSAVEAVNLAFDLMVVDDHHEVRQQSRTQVLNRLRQAFDQDPDLTAFVQRAPIARVGEQTAKIDLAVLENRVRQMSHAWAFDLKDLDQLETNIQAWNYMIGLLRDGGGDLTPRHSARAIEHIGIPADVPIQVVYRPPASPRGEHSLHIALDGWKRLGVDAVLEEDAAQVVAQARELVHA